MSAINLTDVTIHMHDALDSATRDSMEPALRAVDGVVSVHFPEDRPHLLMIEYDPAHATSSTLLGVVTGHGLRAEMIGL